MEVHPEQRDRSCSSSSAISNRETSSFSSNHAPHDSINQETNGSVEYDEQEMSCINDLEAIAAKKLDKVVFDYYRCGADEEQTLSRNRSMISANYYLRPRVMMDVSSIKLTKYIFGDKVSLPIGISPTALHKMAHPHGELATIRACKRANALMILSLFSTTSLEDVAKEAPVCTKWQNLYILKDREITKNVINRAKRFGYRAIVITCDAPTLGKRLSDRKNLLQLGKFRLANIEDSSTMLLKDHAETNLDPSLTWQDLADIKNYVGDTMTVIVKGIMTPHDAEEALRAGADGIFVSNHGGRQLDCMQSTIEALPSIVKAVNKRCPVFVDGGFRTGSDILKGLALGADMVFVGRPALWGLAMGGEEGVFRAIKILEEELKRAMMFCGCTKLEDIDESVVISRQN